MQRTFPSPFMSNDEILRSIDLMRDELVYGVKLIVNAILSDAIVNGNSTELATLHRECELDLEIEDNLDPCNGVEVTTAWILDFNKAYTHSGYATVKAKVTFFDNHGLMTMNNLADYTPDLHRYKIEIIDFI